MLTEGCIFRRYEVQRDYSIPALTGMAAFGTADKLGVSWAVQKYPTCQAFKNKGKIEVCKKKSKFIITLYTCPEICDKWANYIQLLCLQHRTKIVDNFILREILQTIHIVLLMVEVASCLAWTWRTSYFYPNSFTLRFICSTHVNGPSLHCWERPWPNLCMLVFLLLTTNVSKPWL